MQLVYQEKNSDYSNILRLMQIYSHMNTVLSDFAIAVKFDLRPVYTQVLNTTNKETIFKQLCNT